MRLFLFTVLLMLCCTAQSWAKGCSCGSISAMHLVTRQLIVGQLTSHVSAEHTATRTTIVQAAQNIIGTNKANTASIIRMLQSVKESIVAAIKGEGVARETMQTYDLFTSPASKPASLCRSAHVGAGVQIAAQAGRKLSGSMRAKQIAYGQAKAKPVEFMGRILDPSHPAPEKMADAMFPAAITLTPQQVSDAQETIKTIANPNPLPELSASQANSVGGQGYTMARKVHEGRLSIVLDTLTSHVAYHAPTLPDEVTAWAREQWQGAGASGPPPGEVNGKMSEAALYNLLSQMRIGNPNWGTQLATANEAGLLRELLLMQAAQLELTRKNNELLDRISFLAALDYMTRMEGTTGPELEAAYARAVGSVQ